MTFKLRIAKLVEIDKAFELLKSAAKTLAKKGIQQWSYWENPPTEKIEWVKDGFLNNEFFFIENNNEELMGMVRIMKEDIIYWGETNDSAIYVHSLIIHENYAGSKIGSKVLQNIEEDAIRNKVNFFRLDCDSTNLQLCKYYENLGFSKVGLKKLPLTTCNLYQKQLATI
jgi:ribosomal protein S18 acetylase RimI-like enzyme